jgi:hypothetical protein
MHTCRKYAGEETARWMGANIIFIMMIIITRKKANKHFTLVNDSILKFNLFMSE